MIVLADQAARDRFTEALDTNVCISASAGAGKTRAIVDRVEALIRRPVVDKQNDPLDRLVVVTYGEMAAQELKVRCRQRLLSADEPAHLKNQLLARFKQAYFGTIHSFCLLLLRDYGSHLGLPGQIRLLSAKDTIFYERFKQQLDLDELAWPEARAKAALKYYSLEQVFQIAKDLQSDQIDHYLKVRDHVMPIPDVSPLLAYPVPKRSVNTMGRIQRSLMQWQSEVAEDRPFLHLPKVDAGSKDFKQDGQTILEPYREWLAEGAVMMAAHIAEAYRKYRIEQLRLTYDDMISETLRLARDPQSLERMRERGWIIILDEAQDTDASMFQILTEITRPAGACMGEWPDQPEAPGPMPGQFCFVGDDQQCIYSSRADIGRYLDYVQAYQHGSGGERLEFSVTMRCPEPVVSGVNRIFPGRIQQSRAVFREMVASPLRDPKISGLVRLPLEFELEPKASDKKIFDEECRQVADWLRQQGLEGLGVNEWSEVAVMCPRVGWLSAAGMALERAGIPVAHKSTRQVAADRPLYTWPYALFHVMAYPFDRFELIGVLRDIFVIPDAEIEIVHGIDPLGLSIFSGVHAQGPLAAALNFLEQGHVALMGRRKEQPPEPLARTVRRLTEQCQLSQRLAALGEETDGLARFYQSLEEASASGWSVMDWLESERLKLEEPSPPVATMGGLDLISCHKSKGLEWRVVILIGLWRKIGQRSPSYPSVHRQGNKVRVLVSGESAGADWKLRSEQLRYEEYQRLLYVAMTRSKQLLVISDPAVEGKPPHFSGLIRWNEVQETFGSDLPGVKPPAVGELSDPAAPVPTLAQKKQCLEWSQDIPVRLLPHALCEQEDKPVREGAWQLDESEPGIGGVDYGTLWHEWIELMPWGGGTAQHEQYRQDSLASHRAAGLSSAVLKRLESEVDLFWNSDTYQRLRDEGDRFLPELPFMWPMSSRQWMEGVIDLVVHLKSGGWWIVDWKTNRQFKQESSSEFEKRLATHYRPQLDAYRQVCGVSLGDAEIFSGLYLTQAGTYLNLNQADGESALPT